jgi:cytochrome c6
MACSVIERFSAAAPACILAAPAARLRRRFLKISARFFLGGIAALLFFCAGAMAQSPGESIYKAKCASCHGPDGMANTSIGKALKVKPITDPAVKSQSQRTMNESVAKGEGKMPAFQGKLTEKEIHDSVAHFRAFLK